MNVEAILEWDYGKPELAGLYFVAVQFGTGAGEFDFLTWDGEAWVMDYKGDVVAFMDIQKFKNQLNVRWPVGIDKKVKKEVSSDDDPWEEA